MSVNQIKSHFTEAAQLLDQFIGQSGNMDNILKAGLAMVTALKAGGKIISCGNGGSHCDAMHFAEELTGRYRENRNPIAAIAISDVSYISCVANDYGYDQVFSRFVQAMGQPNDCLLAISTSGNSTNIIKAAEMAKSKGIVVIGLTGNDGGRLASVCDIEIRAPFAKYADRAQEIHIKVIHSLIDFIESSI
jgi:D-sedoheptulose 7-phosphate isomerase